MLNEEGANLLKEVIKEHMQLQLKMDIRFVE